MNIYIYIAGVSYSTDEQSLREVFAKYGEVVDGKQLDSLISFFFLFLNFCFFLFCFFLGGGGVPNGIVLKSFLLISI